MTIYSVRTPFAHGFRHDFHPKNKTELADALAGSRELVSRSSAFFLATVVLGVTLRLLAAGVGYNFDIESWDITSKLFLAGKSVYANTYRYPYAPAGIYILGTLKWLALSFGYDGVQAFHLLVAAFLSCVDVTI